MEETTIITQDESLATKKEARRAGNHLGLSMLAYNFMMNAVVAVGIIIIMIGMLVANPDIEAFMQSSAALTASLMEHPLTGYFYIIAALCSLGAVFLCFLKKRTHKEIFTKSNKMTFGKLVGLTCFMYFLNTIGSIGYETVESALNDFGLSTALGLEIASGSQATIGMFIYTSFVGPIVEELIFRGFLLRRMKKHGKALAIVVTSILFGLMHQNLPQVMCATMIGLALGYITLEYSIVWAIVLHIFNNLVVCDLATRVFGNSSDLVQNLLSHGTILATAIVSIVMILRNKESILAWLRNNSWKKSELKWTMSAVAMVISLVFFIGMTIAMIFMG